MVMPIDPRIAAGVQPIDYSNTLAQIGALRQRDQALAQQNQEFGLEQQVRNSLMERQKQADLNAEESDAEWDAAYAAKDWGTMAKIDPEATRIIFAQDQASKPPSPIAYEKTPWGGQLAMQDGKVVDSYTPPAPQQYGPESFSTELDDKGNILLVGNRGTIRETGRKGSKGSSGAGVTIGPNGELMVNPDPSKATEGERTSSNYADRMRAAEALLGSYTPNAKEYMAARMVMQSGPIVASGANKYLSPEGQTYYQAASDWVRAKLRKESGAVISPQEMEQEIKTYFPLPNDAPGTISQKKAAREQALSGMRQMSGRAASPVASSKDDPLGLR
jgi:hypothetical protein